MSFLFDKLGHCQQLGDLLRVAGGVGSDATAKTVDGRAEPVQLDVMRRGHSPREELIFWCFLVLAIIISYYAIALCGDTPQDAK